MSSNSPCAACKFLRRKCTQGCVFAPYFPPDQPTKFANVHRVFGASNVAKLLNELSPAQREDAVNSLAYEAEARLRDPVYGCVSYISFLQTKVKQIQQELCNAKKELATYIGPTAFGPMVPHQMYAASQAHQFQSGNANSSVSPPYGVPGMGIGLGVGSVTPPQAQMLIREQQHQQQQQQQQIMELAAREEILRSYEQQQQELARLNSGYDGRGYNSQLGGGPTVAMAAGPPTGVTLVSSQQAYESGFPVAHQQQPQPQLPPPQQQRAGRSCLAPSSKNGDLFPNGFNLLPEGKKKAVASNRRGRQDRDQKKGTGEHMVKMFQQQQLQSSYPPTTTSSRNLSIL